MPRLAVGDVLPAQVFETINGAQVSLPDPQGRMIHVQFRRFAGCPICNLHLRQFANRVSEFEAAGLVEVAFFHSEPETMRKYQADLPFAVVADPKKAAYRAFGVEEGWRAVLNPGAWGGYFKGLVSKNPSSSIDGEGGHLGLPADFLIDAEGRVLALKYGTHANDQWAVTELLGLAAGFKKAAAA
jgi:peroxiredoxin